MIFVLINTLTSPECLLTSGPSGGEGGGGLLEREAYQKFQPPDGGLMRRGLSRAFKQEVPV